MTAWKESEAGTGSKAVLLSAMTAYITAYDDTAAAKPDIQLTATVNPILNDIDAKRIATWKATNKDKLGEFEAPVRLGLADDETTIAALKAGAVNLFGADGLPIALKPGVSAADVVTPDSLIVGADADGNLNIVVVPKLGSVEGMEEAETQLTKSPNDWLPDWMTSSIDDKVKSIQNMMEYLKQLEQNGDVNNEKPWVMMNIMDQLQSFNPDELQNISTYIANALAALDDPELDPAKAEQIEAYLNSLQTVVDQADTFMGVGNDISAGIADGLQNYDWSGGAGTLASDLESAIRNATQTYSPSQMTVPIGQGIAGGVGQGMTQVSLAGKAQTLGSSVQSAMRVAMAASRFSPIGMNAMLGLAAGITAGRASVVSVIQTVASAAVQAAKDRLQIQSPSRVFADEVGEMIPEGMAKGVVQGTKAQAKVIANAARYLRGSMEDGFTGGIANDNRKSYTTSNNATVNVEKLVVQDKNDVRALAQEIGVVQRRAAIGMGG